MYAKLIYQKFWPNSPRSLVSAYDFIKTSKVYMKVTKGNIIVTTEKKIDQDTVGFAEVIVNNKT